MSAALEISEIQIADSSRDEKTRSLDVVLMSSSFLIDRIFLYTRFLVELDQKARVQSVGHFRA